MGERIGEAGISGPFEELPALLVVLIAISLFSVSVAHAAMSWDDNRDYTVLRDDSRTFAEMVRASEILCGENPAGTYDLARIQNLTNTALAEEFNSTLLGFEYRILILPLGNHSPVAFGSSEMPDARQIAAFHTCVNLVMGGRISGARLTISIWRAPQ